MQLLAVLSVDPALRGLLIVIAAVVILPGSVFLLLSTNLGARLGLLLALAGFFGWMSVQGLIWTIYAQGNRGQDPHWVMKEIVTGQLREHATVPVMEQFPDQSKGWIPLKAGDKILGDAQAAADAVLSKQAAEDAAKSHTGGGGAEAPKSFEPPFAQTTDYVPVAAYHYGGDKWPKISDRIRILTLHHRPHYAVVQVQPVVEQKTAPGGAPPRPVADTSKAITTVVMVRDLGNVRFPPFMLMVSSTVIFGVLASVLHRRDREVMAARAALAS